MSRYNSPCSLRALRVLGGSLVFLLLSSVVYAQGKPEVKGTSPLGIPAGKTARFVVYGENLAPKEVSVAAPLVVKLLEAKTMEGEAKAKGSRRVEVEVVVPVDCPRANFELTLTQPDNQKATAQVAVTESVEKEVEVKKPNNTFAQAMLLSGSSIAVTGNLDNDQPALLRFEAKAGETWEISVLAGRGGSALDALLRVRDGRRLARAMSAGHPKKDRRILFRVRADGSYFVEVGDSQGRGGKEFAYRLSLIRK